MSDMGTFRVTIEIENPLRRGELQSPPDTLVDTGAEFTWAPPAVLESLGIKPEKTLSFRTADGQAIRWQRIVATCAFAFALALPVDASAQNTTVTLLDYRTTVPAAWTARTPSSNMRLAEYVVPPSGGAGGAEVVVYFFGKGSGGSVASNLERWKGQFSTPDGSPVPETVTRDSSGAFPITFAEYRGTYARGIGAGSPDQAKTGQALLAGIAETPRGTLFIQLFGPAAKVAAEREQFVRFVKGLRE